MWILDRILWFSYLILLSDIILKAIFQFFFFKLHIYTWLHSVSPALFSTTHEQYLWFSFFLLCLLLSTVKTLIITHNLNTTYTVLQNHKNYQH